MQQVSIYDKNLTFASLVNYEDLMFWATIAWVFANPFFWNIIARAEYFTHFLTKAFGSKYLGCYFLAVVIFVAGLGRDYTFSQALTRQPQVKELGTFHFEVLSYVLTAVGLVLVLTSFLRLGITGTFLGDYFGILMKEKVTGFPFNVLDNPMYVGSTLLFTAHSLREKSVAGLLITLWVFVIYEIAAGFFEGPFTSRIYSQKGSSKVPAALRSRKTKSS